MFMDEDSPGQKYIASTGPSIGDRMTVSIKGVEEVDETDVSRQAALKKHTAVFLRCYDMNGAAPLCEKHSASLAHRLLLRNGGARVVADPGYRTGRL